VERSKIAVHDRFVPVPAIDEERIARAVELICFPVPDDEDRADTGTEAGLVPAADLIGQLADLLCQRKLTALHGRSGPHTSQLHPLRLKSKGLDRGSVVIDHVAIG